MRVKYRSWAKPYIDEHPDIQISIDELIKLNHLHIEIGAGKGGFIFSLSQANKDTLYIAIERNISCAGFIAKKIVENQLSNVKLMVVDAVEVLEQLPSHSVSSFYLNFSDPWPKKRHEKRRLTYPTIVNKYADKLESGGHLYFKTDNDELYYFSKTNFMSSDLKMICDEFDYDGKDPFDYPTEYEHKKRLLNYKIHRLILEKI